MYNIVQYNYKLENCFSFPTENMLIIYNILIKHLPQRNVAIQTN